MLRWWIGALVILGALAAAVTAAEADDGRRMDGWYSYDYREGLDVEPAVNVFRASTSVGGTVWVGHRRWSIDDPESPPSVLALVRYAEWDTSGGRVETTQTPGDDLRGGCVSFDLRGQDLDLKGSDVTFWVMGAGQRWHTTLPLELGDDWQHVEVDIDRAEWHNSWRWDPSLPPDVDATMAAGTSFGIGFVGFGDTEPIGMLGLRDFRIGC